MAYKVLVEKEYRKLSRDEATIGLLMMLKNEEARIQISLDSVLGYIDAMIIYDTGSTDNTIDIVKNFSEKHKINLYMIQGTFIDFSTSRNVSLDYADTKDVHYLLLLDCNDELQGGDLLRAYCRTMLKKDSNGFLVCQQWLSNCLEKYYNMRLVKARGGWRYFGSVHEWMKDTTIDGDGSRYQVCRLPDDIALYQDRTKDNNKSGPRFARDKILLLKDYEKNPHDSRTLFYLAQTCACVGDKENALYYSKLRLEEKGFEEERFISFVRSGDLSAALGHSWYDVMNWYMKAYEHSQRIEPLLKIADHYRFCEKWHVAYMFAHEACQLIYPEHAILFVDKGMYDYYRWHVMAMIASHIGRFTEGKEASLKAIAANVNKELNEKIYKDFYEKIPDEKPVVVPIDKKAFIEAEIQVLLKKFPGTPIPQLTRRAEAMWKKRKAKK